MGGWHRGWVGDREGLFDDEGADEGAACGADGDEVGASGQAVEWQGVGESMGGVGVEECAGGVVEGDVLEWQR